MKKVLLFASAVAVAAVASAQVVPADYDNAALNKNLNDSINKFYTVTNEKLVQVAGLEVVDSSMWRIKGYTNTTSKLYTKSSNAKNELEVVFDRAKGGTDNYEDFNLVWAGWGKKAFAGSPRTGMYPFPQKVTGTVAAPAVADAATQDTLFGYAVNLYEKPKVTIKVSASAPTNIRIDLIDKNRRVANVLAPHHLIKSANRDTTLEFLWDYRPEDADGNEDWKSEDAKTDDFNVGVAADGWAGKWWDVDAGRNTATVPFLGGRTAWKGAVVLDKKNIVGLAVTIEDGPITGDHKTGVAEYDYGYSMTAVKTVTFKSIIVGSTSSPIKITKDNMIQERVGDVVIPTTESSVLVGTNVGRVFNVTAPATLVSVIGGAAIATSVDGVITTDAPKGYYFIVSEAGVAQVLVQ